MADQEHLEIAKAGVRMYTIWSLMQGRCNNLQNKAYHRYGARGIKIEWSDFDQFFNDMYPTYSDLLTLDRIDNDGNYSKDNCRWATRTQQANNRSSNVLLQYRGETHTIQEWAKILGMKSSVIGMRIRKYGWTIEKALSTPTRAWGKEKI